MISFRKKLTTALLSVLAVLCLVCALIFTVPVKTAAAAEGDQTEANAVTTLTDEEDGGLTVENGIIIGYDEEKLTADQPFSIEITTATSIADADEKGIFEGKTNLTSVKIGGTLESIGTRAFYGCTNLEILDLSEAVKLESIGNYAFNGAGIKELDFSETAVETVGDGAFKNCGSLASIALCEGITSIGNEAFYNNNVRNFNVCVPASVTSIGENAFYNTPTEAEFTNADFDLSGSVVTGLKDETTDKIKNNSTYTVELTGVSVADEVFDGQTKLRTLKITAIPSEGSIGTKAFNGCTKLTNVELSGTKYSIGESAFAGTNALNVLTLGEGLTTVGANAFSVTEANRQLGTFATLTIPASVTSIGNLAFANRGKLTAINFLAANCADFSASASENPFFKAGTGAMGLAVKIGDATHAVKKIPANMFRASAQYALSIYTVNFENVNLSSADDFGAYAFYNCASLTNVTFGAGCNIPAISDYAFAGCRTMSAIDITGTTAIGAHAFDNCIKLKDITLPNVTSIGEGAFANCAMLKNITIPAGVTAIAASTFTGCSALTSLALPNVTTIGSSAFSNSGLTKIAIPATVTSIGDDAFSGCTSLTEATYANGSRLASIGKRAFSGCTSLATVTIPSGVTTLGSSAYLGCENVTTVNYSAQNISTIAVSGEHPFSGIGTKGAGVTVNISGVSTVPANMFYNGIATFNIAAVNFKNVTGPASIGASAFRNCSTLKTVTFEDCNIESIGSYAFYGCSALSSFELPNGIKTIDSNAFQMCRSIITLTIPSTVTSIGTQAFNACERLFEVIDLRTGSTLKAGDTTDGEVARYAISVLHDSSSSSAIINQGDYRFIKDSQGNYYLIEYIGTASAVTLPANVSDGGTLHTYYVRDYAFQNNTNITSVTIGAGVLSIGNFAFYQCTNLRTVEIDANAAITNIGTSAFQGCTMLYWIQLNNSLNTLSTSVFEGCYSLSQITLPASLSEIGSHAFSNSGLTSITIPAGVKTIQTSAFEGCSYLDLVVFEEGSALTTIGANAFADDVKLVAIELPASVESVGNAAFSGCTGLVSVSLPAGATYGSNVFTGCGNGLIIIFADKTSYEADKSNFGAYRTTYLVTVKLIYNDKTYTENKLYGLAYSYVKNDDGSWTNTGSALPVQEDYSQSVWFADKDLSNRVSETTLNSYLYNDSYLEENDQTVVLYAAYIAKPQIEKIIRNYSDFQNNRLEINEGNLADINAALFGSNSPLTSQYTLKISSYSPYVGSTETDRTYILDAGNYVIEINLVSDTFGSWAESAVFEVTVERSNLDINDADIVRWVLKTGNDKYEELLGNTNTPGDTDYIWVPENSESGLLPLYPLGDMPDGYVEKQIKYSYVRYSGGNWEVEIYPNNDMFTVENYDGNIYKNVGMYAAQAKLVPGNNYIFTPGATGDTLLRGISFSSNSDGSFTVTKVWYIVSVQNTIWAGQGSTELFSISGWTYNQATASDIPAEPTVSYSSTGRITYGLTWTYNGVTSVISNKGSDYSYSDLINASMPAGDYVLTVYVPESRDEDGNLIPEFAQEYSFTIANASLYSLIEGSSIDSLLKGKSFSVKYNGEVQLYDDETIKLPILGLASSAVHPAGTGVWATNRDASEFYNSSVQISYNLYRMQSNKYYTVEEFDKATAKPVNPDNYIVYYQISAPGYEPLVNVSDDEARRTYYFNLTIYDEILLPAATNVIYTGLRNVPVIASSEYYQIIYLDSTEGAYGDAARKQLGDDSYIDYNEAGHKIALRIFDKYSGIYVWGDGIETFGTNKEYAVLTYNILRAQNSTTTNLSILSWTWGSPANAPVWKTQFGDDYTFTLISAFDHKEYEGLKAFDTAPAGTYTLVARAAGSNNWAEYEDRIENVLISKIDNYWTIAPNLYDWDYGDDKDETIRVPNAQPHYGYAVDVVYTYYKVDANGNVTSDPYKKIEDMCVDGYLPVGFYMFTAELEGASSYKPMTSSVYFKVNKSENSWLTVPVIISWSEGHYDKKVNAYEAVSEFGFVIFTVTDANGKQVDIKNLGSLGVGSYTLTATVAGNENYEGLKASTTFAVFEDSVSMTGIIAATIVFAVIAVALAGVAIFVIIRRQKKLDMEFRRMVSAELHNKRSK